MKRFYFPAANIGSAALCFGALGPMPYNYFILLRWVVFLTCCWAVWRLQDRFSESFGPVYLAIGVLMNPILPFHFKRSTWNLIDVGVAVVLLAALVKSTPKAR